MKGFGYSNKKDELWAKESAKLSKSGLPYGVSPSNREEFCKRHNDGDVFWIIALVCFGFILLMV